MAGRANSSRGTLVFLTCLLAVPTVPSLIYGAPDMASLPAMKPYLLVGAILGLFHLILRPVLRMLSAPLGCLTLGVAGIAIDLGLIYLSASLLPGFPQPAPLCAALTALLINAVAAALRAR